jgi:hypothetical protein
MNWYVAKLVFRITCGNGNHPPQFDEQLRLISASCEKEALKKGKNLIYEEKIALENNDQSPIRWDFINMTELYQVNELKDGSEIYCTIEMSNQKALLISQNQQASVTTTI